MQKRQTIIEEATKELAAAAGTDGKMSAQEFAKYLLSDEAKQGFTAGWYNKALRAATLESSKGPIEPGPEIERQLVLSEVGNIKFQITSLIGDRFSIVSVGNKNESILGELKAIANTRHLDFNRDRVFR